jgi:hypothetical protein
MHVPEVDGRSPIQALDTPALDRDHGFALGITKPRVSGSRGASCVCVCVPCTFTYRRGVDQPGPALLAKVAAEWVGCVRADLQVSRLSLDCVPVQCVSRRRRPPATTATSSDSLCSKLPRVLPVPVTRESGRLHPRVTAQQLGIRQLEPGEDGRGAKRRARLALARVAVANVQCQGLLGRRLEPDGPALTASVHLGGEAGWFWLVTGWPSR